MDQDRREYEDSQVTGPQSKRCNYSYPSVGPTGVCWAVDKKETVWRRLGAKSSNPIGSKWQSVTGRLSHITVGQAGVWGISPKNEVR